jgi:hypothetical protein
METEPVALALGGSALGTDNKLVTFRKQQNPVVTKPRPQEIQAALSYEYAADMIRAH